MDKYTTLHKATGGLIQKDKSFYYRWRWINKHGKLYLEEFRTSIGTHEEKLYQIKNNDVMVCMSPALKWKH